MRNEVGVERGRNKVSFYIIVILWALWCNTYFKQTECLMVVVYLLSKGLERNATNELICNTETDSESLKTNLWLPKGKGAGGGIN